MNEIETMLAINKLSKRIVSLELRVMSLESPATKPTRLLSVEPSQLVADALRRIAESTDEAPFTISSLLAKATESSELTSALRSISQYMLPSNPREVTARTIGYAFRALYLRPISIAYGVRLFRLEHARGGRMWIVRYAAQDDRGPVVRAKIAAMRGQPIQSEGPITG